MLHINDLTYRIGGRVLFDRATVAIPAGHRVGLVGRNGSGKTTLLKLVRGELAADGGSISLSGAGRIGGVAQEAPSGPDSLIDTVLAADAERAALLAESETAADPHRIAEIHTRLADIGAHAAHGRAAAILSGLGFDEEAQQRPCSSLSGGWRMRVALAAALFAEPDLLLLDEPTNHLDLEATMWLENHLASWPGTLLVISHERNLLNRVVNEIVHLENKKLNRYSGNYDRFERTRRERLAVQARAQARQKEEERRIRAFVDRFRAKATKARQAQSRLKMLDRMEPIASVIEEYTVEFQFPNPDPQPPPLITVEGGVLGYGDAPPVLKNVNLRIDMDDRIALIGANGNGKSTLVKLLGGRLDARDGQMRRPGKLRVGYFAQHQAEELDLDATPYDHMARLMPMAAPSKVRAHLGRFGFGENHADQKVRLLSGGEKARLLFALMSRDAPHLLLLDEPTNHLDVDAREALVQALNAYDGAVVLVSHDDHLIDLVCDRLWLVADGTCKAFDGDLDDYRRLLLEQRRGERRSTRASTNGGEKKQARRDRAAARAEKAGMRQAARDAEKRMEKLDQQRLKLEERLADPEVYQGPTAKLMDLQVRHGEIKQKLAKAEQAWLAAQEALEED